MASVEDVPEDLRPLARQVPFEYRIKQSPAELRARCEEASELLAEADGKKSKARDAERMLSAVPQADFERYSAAIINQIREADLRGDGSTSSALKKTLQDLDKENPQPYERLFNIWIELALEAERAERERQFKKAARTGRRVLFRRNK
jgi:hypothetical protein